MKKTKQALIVTIGIIFILVGLIGLVLPFLQGILFIAIGLFLLSLYSPKIRSFTEKHTEKYPQIHKKIKKVEGWLTKVVGEI